MEASRESIDAGRTERLSILLDKRASFSRAERKVVTDVRAPGRKVHQKIKYSTFSWHIYALIKCTTEKDLKIVFIPKFKIKNYIKDSLIRTF